MIHQKKSENKAGQDTVIGRGQVFGLLVMSF